MTGEIELCDVLCSKSTGRKIAGLDTYAKKIWRRSGFSVYFGRFHTHKGKWAPDSSLQMVPLDCGASWRERLHEAVSISAPPHSG